MKRFIQLGCFVFLAATARGQVQVELKFKRLHYVAHEPVVATVKITNLAGRDIDLRDNKNQPWFGFQINDGEDRLLAPLHQREVEPAFHLEAGKAVSRKINLTPIFPVYALGAYHVRATVYFADLNQFFSSPVKVIQVADARPVWRETVGIPDGMPGSGEVRTYSLLSYRFPDHTSLYVRVANEDRSIVYATYALGRLIAQYEPQRELDRVNQLHVLHCVAPRSWAYSHIDASGRLVTRSTFTESRTRPRLRRSADGVVAVRGGRLDLPAALPSRNSASRFSSQLHSPPVED